MSKIIIPNNLKLHDRADKVILSIEGSISDNIMLTGAVRDLKNSCPVITIDVRNNFPEVWENNPYINPIEDDDINVKKININYKIDKKVNNCPYHRIHIYRKILENQLKIDIIPGPLKGDIHLTEKEKQSSLIKEKDYWIIISGTKHNRTSKLWDIKNYQQIVDNFDHIKFVQCGKTKDNHPVLNNVINLLDKTNFRELIQLIHHSVGIICSPGMLMHLSAAIDTKIDKSLYRHCIVVAGGRENSIWNKYPGHQYLSVEGELLCCAEGGCWENTCKNNSMCMNSITSEEVISIMKKYIPKKNDFLKIDSFPKQENDIKQENVPIIPTDKSIKQHKPHQKPNTNYQIQPAIIKNRKVILANGQSPGDILMLTAAVRDLKLSHPEILIDVRTPCPEIWENNPYLTPLKETDKDIEFFNVGYSIVHNSNEGQYHFIHGFRKDIETKLNIKIEPTLLKADIHLSNEEKSWYSAIYEILNKDVPYWIINAGYKKDFTCKQWDFRRYQKIIDNFPHINFVQVGLKHDYHIHPELKGKNLINLLGKTDDRQLIRLVYNSFGVITPCSYTMVLAYSVPAHPRFKRKTRACIVIAGGREPNVWQQAPNQQFLHTCGMLECYDNGGCWKSRVVPLGDGDEKDINNLCTNSIKLQNKQIIPQCMNMISSEEVILIIKKYMKNLKYAI